MFEWMKSRSSIKEFFSEDSKDEKPLVSPEIQSNDIDIADIVDVDILIKIWDKHTDEWKECTLQLEMNNDARYVMAMDGTIIYKRVLLERTSYVHETNLALNSFEIVTVYTIAHFSCPSLKCCQNWIAILKQYILKCDPYPTDLLLRETLRRYPGDTYTVRFSEKKPLGLVFDKSPGEWANVRSSQNEFISTGSVLSAIDDYSVAMLKYEDVIDRLRHWSPPLKLAFRRPPEKQGYLLKLSSLHKNSWRRKYFILKEGKLLIQESPTSSVQDHCSLVGCGIVYGYDKIILQAENEQEMFNWACAIYHCMALLNGGGYILSLLMVRIESNASREEVENAARSRTPVKRFSSSDQALN